MMQNVDVISDQQAHIVPVSDEGDIQALIKPIRGVQVILDRDVARLYGVATGALNRQVKRNDRWFSKRKTTREVRHLLVLYRRGIPRLQFRGCGACGGEKPKYGIMCA